MKRWAVLTVLLYALALVLLTVPVMLAAFGNWGINPNSASSLNGISQIYLAWGYWLWLAVLAGGQALLLLLPLKIAERRLPARRPLRVPVIVTAFFLANLCFAGIFSLLCAIFTDRAFALFNWFAFLAATPNQPGQSNNNDSGWSVLFSMISLALVFWLFGASSFGISPDKTTRTRSSNASPAGSCAAASSNSSSPCPATSSSAAATIAARPPARSGALPPASPSCCSVSVPGFSTCSSNVSTG